MLPDTVGAVVGVLLAIAPGLVFAFVREKRRPTAERSAFTEAAWIAATSIAFSAVALVIILLVQMGLPRILADPSEWLADGHAYVVDHVAQVVAFVLSWTVLGCVLAAVTAQFAIQPTAAIDPNTTAWFVVFRTRVPPNRARALRIRLNDGEEYIGRLVYYDAHLLHGDREIVIGPPLLRKPADSQDFVPLPPGEGWERIVIPATSIQAMWVRYPPL